MVSVDIQMQTGEEFCSDCRICPRQGIWQGNFLIHVDHGYDFHSQDRVWLIWICWHVLRMVELDSVFVVHIVMYVQQRLQLICGGLTGYVE